MFFFFFLLSVQNEEKKLVISGCCTNPALTWNSSDSLSPRQMEVNRLFPIRSYQPSFTQLPDGIFVTLHKIVMTSPSRWALLFYFFSPFSGGPQILHHSTSWLMPGMHDLMLDKDDSKSILKSPFQRLLCCDFFKGVFFTSWLDRCDSSFFSQISTEAHTQTLPPPPESSNPSVDNQEHEKDLKHCSANDDMKTAPLKRCCTKNKGALRATTTDYTTADRMLNSKSVWSRKTCDVKKQHSYCFTVELKLMLQGEPNLVCKAASMRISTMHALCVVLTLLLSFSAITGRRVFFAKHSLKKIQMVPREWNNEKAHIVARQAPMLMRLANKPNESHFASFIVSSLKQSAAKYLLKRKPSVERRFSEKCLEKKRRKRLDLWPRLWSHQWFSCSYCCQRGWARSDQIVFGSKSEEALRVHHASLGHFSNS